MRLSEKRTPMPIKSCTLPNGKKGSKYGDSGKCYASRARALRQAAAIQASQKAASRMKTKKGPY